MDFPYTESPTKRSLALPDRFMLHRPVWNVLLRKNNKAVTAKSIIDSGANTYLFPASYAKLLGIPMPNERRLQFSGTADLSPIA